MPPPSLDGFVHEPDEPLYRCRIEVARPLFRVLPDDLDIGIHHQHGFDMPPQHLLREAGFDLFTDILRHRSFIEFSP